MDISRLNKIAESLGADADVCSEEMHLALKLASVSVKIDSDKIQVPIPDPKMTMGFIVLRAQRTGPPKSFKISNATRELSRTVYLTSLIAAAPLSGSWAIIGTYIHS